jgi:RNA polymerase sigma-70 factor (ECF subfamily)
MTGLDTTERILPGETVMDENQDDLSLLGAIAQHRDNEAFEALYKRYQKRAYSLAFRILRNPALAEDAVQEAMLAIWLSAKSIQPNSNAKDWIIRIVMNKSINIGCSRKRSAKREERTSMEKNGSQPTVVEAAEENEIIAVLRNHVDRLPDLERTLLACSYCASMSHHEIAGLVGIPDRTVSNKIQKALNQLYIDLSKAGVAAVVPMVSSNLFEAMTTGHDSPAGMSERLVERLVNHESVAQPLSQRATAIGRTKASIFLFFAGSAFVLTVAGGAIWWGFFSSNNPAPQITSTGTPTPQIKNKRQSIRWTFDKPASALFTVLQGDWHWQKSPDTDVGEMSVSPDAPLVVVLPIQLPKKPFVVTLQLNPRGHTGKSGVDGLWLNERQVLPHKMWNATHNSPRTNFDASEYFLNETVVEENQGYLATVCEFSSAYPTDRVCLVIENLSVLSIEVKTLEPDEIPPAYRDRQAMINQLVQKGAVSREIQPVAIRSGGIPVQIDAFGNAVSPSGAKKEDR